MAAAILVGAGETGGPLGGAEAAECHRHRAEG